MVAVIALSLLLYQSIATGSNETSYSFFQDSNITFNDFNSHKNKKTEFHSLKMKSSFICNGVGQELQINDENFQNTAAITNENTCSSIKIFHCTFTNVAITSISQTNGQISIIYIKSIDLFIDDSTFSNCYSNIIITRSNTQDTTSAKFPISNYIICHAVYIDENADHVVNITKCSFSDNGIPTETDGSIIYSNKADKINIEFSIFNSDTTSTRALETFYTKDINLISNSFNKMKSPKNQNGGALLIQFADNVQICDCIFDSNTLQPDSSQTTDSNIYGSAFFINLKSTLTFLNNTITNHADYLNSVITFNSNELTTESTINGKSLIEENLPIKRKVTISDSKFIQNSFSKAKDGNGIGLFIEDYSEDDTASYFLLTEFLGCFFEKNGNNDCSSSVLEWTRKTSLFSFLNCVFDSNTAKDGSSMLTMTNGPSLVVEDCAIENMNGLSFLQFEPLTTAAPNSQIKSVEVIILHSTFTGDSTKKVGSDFILAEGETLYDFILNVDNSTFSELYLNSNQEYLIKSSSNNLQVLSCQFNHINSGSNAICTTKGDSNVTIDDSNFTNCLSVVHLNEQAEQVTIKNCNFIDCKSDPVLYINASMYFAYNCCISFATKANVVGMKIDNSNNSEINLCTFINTGNSAIESLYDLNSSLLSVSSTTITGCSQSIHSVHTSNKIVYFLNNSIINEDANEGSRGLFVDTIADVNINECTFINCNNPKGNNNAGGAITYLNSKANPTESITISNTEFTGCIYRSGAIFIQARLEIPQFTNVVISNSTCGYSIIILIPEIPENTYPYSRCILDNVSFINIINEENAGGGIGFWLQPDNSKASYYGLYFTNCLFRNTSWTGRNFDNYGGGAISIESKSCQNFDVSINYCSFYQTSVLNSCHGGAIAIVTNKMASVNNIYIEDCSSVGSTMTRNGGAIYVYQNGYKSDFNVFNITVNGSITSNLISAFYFAGSNGGALKVDRCRFINCLTSDNTMSSILKVEQNSLVFNCVDTIFKYDTVTHFNSRAVDVHTPVFTFNQCFFTRCGKPSLDFGGAILYDEILNVDIDEDILITLCTFTSCQSNNCGSFRLNIFNGLPVLKNNTYKDINCNYNLALIFSENVQFSPIQFELQFFIGCTNHMNDGGGSGIWVNNHRADGNVYPTNIQFSECGFYDCVSTKTGGGGFGIGESPSVQPSELNFNSCTFVNNSCLEGYGGGAIYARTAINGRASNCVFRDNHAGAADGNALDGGAVYVRFINNIPSFYLVSCNFTNNSVLNPNGKGHAIFGANLFAPLYVQRCNLTDNGYGVEGANSIIYSDSNIQIEESSFVFTDKSMSFSRGMTIGASSDINLYDSKFVNCSDPTGIAGSVYYQIISTRENRIIKIDNCIFDSNTDGSSCYELYLLVHKRPYISNCTFMNDNTTSGLVMIKFDAVGDLIGFLSYVTLTYSSCINCDLHNKNVLNYIDANQDEVLLEDFTFDGCVFDGCSNFGLIHYNIFILKLTDTIFRNNVNDNHLLLIDVLRVIEILGCSFINNTIKCTDNSSAIILVSERCVCYINHAVFQDNINEHNENEYENCFNNSYVMKVSSYLELTYASFIDCPTFKYSLYLAEKEGDTSSLIFHNSLVNNSGSVLIENQINSIRIISTNFSNCHDGFIYTPEKNDSSVSSVLISESIFDSISNYALRLFVFNNLSLYNNTIKNCQRDEDNPNPIFELDFQNNNTNHIVFDQFIFENNSFNNSNNSSLINGGGIGLSIVLFDVEEIFIDFVNSSFISNYAAKCGGAFAYIDNEYSPINSSFSFTGCIFKGNSCNNLKGHALYIEAKNVCIENCTFEDHNFQTKTSVDTLEELTPDKIRESSVVYISSVHNETVSVINSSFYHNKASSLFIKDCEKDVLITGCLFSSNEITSVNNSDFNGTFSLDNDIMAACIVTILTAKEAVTIQNCCFQNNSHNSNAEGSIVNAGSIYVDTQMTFSMKNVTFYDNNINDLIMKAELDVSVIDCQFIGLENETFVKGCAAIIDSKKTVTIQNCDIRGYASILTSFPDGTSMIMTPIQITAEDNCQLTNITVGDVAGDVMNVTSPQSVTVENCTFEASSESPEVNSGKLGGDFFIICHCQKLFSMDNVSIAGHDGAVCLMQSTECLVLTNSQISECRIGIVSQPEGGAIEAKTSIMIENFTFSELKNAILCHMSYDQIILEKVVFYHNCNLETGTDKRPIIDLKIHHSKSTELTFSKVNFEDNEYLQTSSKEVAGGIGFLVSQIDSSSGSKPKVSIEFNGCNFLTNKAVGTLNSGGGFSFSEDSISVTSLSFTSCNFKENRADSTSGAAYIKTSVCSSIEVVDCFFEMNNATRNYGALYIECNCSVLIDSCSFLNNSATSENFGIRTDSLYVSTSSSSLIKDSNFTKSIFIYEESGYQAIFSNNINNGNNLFEIDSCLFSIINPTLPQVMLIVIHEVAKTNINKSSFTHFFAYDEEDVNSTSEAASNSTSNFSDVEVLNFNFRLVKNFSSNAFYHLSTDSVGTISFNDCCFDTNKSFAISPNLAKKANIKEIIEGATFNKNIFADRKKVCLYPSIIDDLIKEIADPVNNTDDDGNKKNNEKKKLILGLSIGAAALVLIVVAIIVVVVIYKKKHKEMAKTIEFSDELEKQMEQEQYDAINCKYDNEMFKDKTEQNKPSKVSNIRRFDKDYEESGIEEFDL